MNGIRWRPSRNRMPQKIVGVIDYQAGNIASVLNAIEYCGAVTRRVKEPLELEECTHLVLPGVGAFGFCAERLLNSKIFPAVERWALIERKPILGICVGMQLMADYSTENGQHAGLGWVGGEVEKIHTENKNIRIPHVGWNDVFFAEPFGDFHTGDKIDFYFDHSYAYKNLKNGKIIGCCEHGEQFIAIIRKDNIVAVQFHPEKSQTAGLRFLRNFLSM